MRGVRLTQQRHEGVVHLGGIGEAERIGEGPRTKALQANDRRMLGTARQHSPQISDLFRTTNAANRTRTMQTMRDFWA